MLSFSLRGFLLIVLAATSLALIAVSAASAQQFPRHFGWATLVDPNGETVGAAALAQKKGEVRIYAWATGLTPGKHGFHIHAVGACDDPAFASAGSHFNPAAHQHGLRNPEGPHNGDLPNMKASENGLGILRAATDRVTLSDGPKSLFDSDGSALIVHADEDDQVTDPTGNSGARIICGVIHMAQ